MDPLSVEKRASIIAALVDGNSVRATGRITGVAKGAILELLEDVGAACLERQRSQFRDLPCKTLQCDLIWSFCYAKERTLSSEQQGILGSGDVWTWTAICADTKIVPTFRVGRRSADDAELFMKDVVWRLKNRVQLTTDGHKSYLSAVENAFGWNGVDYGVLIKLYGPTAEGTHRYNPPAVLNTEARWVMGTPDPKHISTSDDEHSNLTLWMSQQRFTRLMNVFSKKVQNLRHAVALHFMHYNFCRPHTTLTKASGGIHTTPAMAAGLETRVCKTEEIAALVD
jgi:hypothetical protein